MSEQAPQMSASKIAALSSHIIFLRNLPYRITPQDIIDLVQNRLAPASEILPAAPPGTTSQQQLPHNKREVEEIVKLRQIRIGNGKETRGTAYLVFDKPEDARRAVDLLNGFNMQGRYLIVLPFQANKVIKNRPQPV